MIVLDDNKPLLLLAVGFAGGGTTLLSEILRQHPSLDSGFEGGFLLADSPSKFPEVEPHFSNMKKMWNLTDRDMHYICQAESWPQMYRRLRNRSSVIKDKKIKLFDKTPRYMMQLKEVLKKVPNVPCIVLVRDPRAFLWTRAKRTQSKSAPNVSKQEWASKIVEESANAYLDFANGYRSACESGLEDRMLLVQYESLCLDQYRETERIFDFANLKYSNDVLNFSNKDERYTPCHGTDISTDYINQYKKNLAEETCQKMLDLTRDFSSWFWDV